MPIWDKVRQELDRAGRAAQGAIDEGKLRLEAMRARQLADRAAQALGYAVYRARAAGPGQDIDAESYGRLSAALAAREADVTRLDAQIREAADRGRAERGPGPNEPPAADRATPDAGPPAQDTPPPPAAPGEPHQPL